MKSFFRLLSLFYMGIIPTMSLSADNKAGNNRPLAIAEIPPEEEIRILTLLPHLLVPLAVEPALPQDFVAKAPNGELDPYDWIYWGPPAVLEDYFKNQTLSQAIIRVKLSANTIQKGPKIDIGDKKAYIKEVEATGAKNVKIKEYQWGNYPVLALDADIEQIKTIVAWVGLNDPTAGWTLLFQLLPHDKPLSKQDKEIWKNFLAKTKQLPEPLFFKANGQDLQEGYTVVNLDGSKVKAIAEFSLKEKKMQIAIIPIATIPLTPSIEFEFKSMDEGLMGAQWNRGKPLLKIRGVFTKKDDHVENVIDYVISVFPKAVDNFTFTQEEIAKFPKAFFHRE